MTRHGGNIVEQTRVAYHCSSSHLQEDTTVPLETPQSVDDVWESFECILGQRAEDDDNAREDRDEKSPDLTERESSSTSSSSRVCPPPTSISGECETKNTHEIPHLAPAEWPQAPLLFRPKPDGMTSILGIRKEASHTEFLWRPGQNETWYDVLRREYDPTYSKSGEDPVFSEHDEHSVILPINNGMEKPGEALVIDFESPLFRGTMMLRLQGTPGIITEPSDGRQGYFDDKIIRYQVVIRGRFKKEIPFSTIVTGYRFRRPCGKLPPTFVMWAAMKVIHFFAPQLSMKLEKCDRPYMLSPFGSAPRTILVEDADVSPENSDGIMTRELSEPTKAHLSILQRDNPIKDSLERARARKKRMDQSFISKSATPATDPDKLYTFEFLQHLMDYQKFQIDVSQSLHVKLKDILDGQPLQIMAEVATDLDKETSAENELFAFEVWHESLWQAATAKGIQSS